MSWIEKAQPTSFDDRPLPGLFFLDGDILARRIGRTWTAGQKYPMIAFPSGKECELWETSDPDAGAIVHIFGEIDLPFRDSRDRAYEQASEIAEACGYLTRKQGEDRLELWGHDTDEHVVVLYDTASGHMLDIQPIPDEARVPLRLPLLTEAIKKRLPALYANEELGLDAQALVKFFTPDAGWTWYASEFDGEDLFFGLVIGHEIELGYFSLSELESVRGPWGLPIERDRFFEPARLRDLQDQHCRERQE